MNTKYNIAFRIFLFFLLIFTINYNLGINDGGSGAAPIDNPDQSQPNNNYGFWFERTVVRWQEFIPSYTVLSRVDIKISKAGSPGDVLLAINDTNGRIWNTTIKGNNIVTGWLNVTLSSSLGLIPGNSYKLIVWSNQDSPGPSDMYVWKGYRQSNYLGSTDVQSGWPNYDYSFVLWNNYDSSAYVLNQAQTQDNYGFWFDRTIVRWQEFIPIHPSISKIDLQISKSGNPGNVLVAINDTNGRIWNTTIDGNTVVTGWLNITLDSSLALIPGNSYKLIVWSNQDSASTSDRYFWKGQTNSNYTQGMTDVQSGLPTYDYGFVLWSYYNQYYTDQAVSLDNYGFWFERTVVRWQEFIPTHSTITKIDLRITKSGNPGNVLVAINDTNGRIWNTTVDGKTISSGWLTIKIDKFVPLIAGEPYKLIVWSNQDSASPSDRYFWKGHTLSNYTQGMTDVQSGLPTYDYSFKTSSNILYLDQAQEGTSAGFAFDETLERWQEFTPQHSTISQIDLYINKVGNPGDLKVSLWDNNDKLWNTTIKDIDVVYGWNQINVSSLVKLIPGEPYYIKVKTDRPSTSTSDRYYLMGDKNSNYTAGITDIQSPWPTFDYSFRTWSVLSGPSIKSVSHTPINPTSLQDVTFSADIRDPHGFKSNQLVYRVDNGNWISVNLVQQLGSSYFTVVIDLPGNSVIDYYIDSINTRNIRSVMDNGGSYYSFSVYGDSVLPEINSLPDISFINGETNNILTWNVGDANPDVYNITLDGNLISNNYTWVNGTIKLNVDGISDGTHTVVITIYDEFGNQNSDTVIVNVIAKTTSTSSISSSDTTTSSDSETSNPQGTITSTSSLTDDSSSSEGDGPNLVNGISLIQGFTTLFIIIVFYRRKKTS